MDRRVREIEAVYGRRYLAFRNALIPVTGSLDAAHDVVQEAFVRALKHRTQFRGDGPLEAWIWRIAVRCAYRRPLAEAELPDGRVLEDHLGPLENDVELVDVLRRLAPRRRLFVFLHYIADLSYRDIAAATGVSEGTVAATLAQSRESLRALFQERDTVDQKGRHE